MPVVGVAKAGWGLEELKARARESVQAHGGLDTQAFARLCSLLRYIDGDYRDPSTFGQLRTALGASSRPLHYLAIHPSMFATVAEGLAGSGCAAHARVVVEKPFGRDLKSAQQLNATLRRFFPEKNIFRIDHYLGKEPVQNLLYFRFANPFIDAVWNRDHVEEVQITMAEDFGVAGRGKFYEEAGAIRDVVQNHMLQVLAALAMECPAEKNHEAMRNERARVLSSVRTLEASDVVRGQCTAYRHEEGVAPDSKVETFAAVRFSIDNDRWEGVPFFVRAGKYLPVSVTEVMVRFKRPERPVLDDTWPPPANYYRFRLSPEVVIAQSVKVKRPGPHMSGDPIEMVAHYQPPDEMEPYERLLGDAADGEPTLFAREDAVEASWRTVDPVLGNATPLFEYPPHTWGPPEAYSSLVPEGRWHDPLPEGRPT
jgi:glucose-6-phosphate 1-dehydrogenase